MQSRFSIYPEDANASLEFDKICDLLDQQCIGPLGRKALASNHFSYQKDELNFVLRQVLEMKFGLENNLKFPAQNYHDLSVELKALGIVNNVIEGKQFRKILDTNVYLSTALLYPHLILKWIQLKLYINFLN